MNRTLILIVIVLSIGLGTGWTNERLPVLEFFGRPNGTFCRQAGPAMIRLQAELEGQAVLLEYDFDDFGGNDVINRFWAADPDASYLPLVMVGSGYRTHSGYHADHYEVYSGLIADESARAPRADVEAWWRRSGDLVRCYASVHNTSDEALQVNQSAEAWFITYEKARIGVSDTWVRSATRKRFAADIEPGETADLEVEAVVSTMGDWQRAGFLFLVDDRPSGGNARFDMIQAAEARPATLEAAPESLVLSTGAPTAELTLRGPHVLEWTAETDAAWLQIEPASGRVPDTFSVTYRPELQPPGEMAANVAIHAVGDAMVFDTSIGVVVGGMVRRSGGRVTPDP
ncbi:MAG: hypothetical protein V2I67_02445 [Thermoanaerobaculales bacterium]|jgi:hypothetical protein|nr:hypothetical protein [Thermoanaerobaculales bacterium]